MQDYIVNFALCFLIKIKIGFLFVEKARKCHYWEFLLRYVYFTLMSHFISLKQKENTFNKKTKNANEQTKLYYRVNTNEETDRELICKKLNERTEKANYGWQNKIVCLCCFDNTYLHYSVSWGFMKCYIQNYYWHYSQYCYTKFLLPPPRKKPHRSYFSVG